MKIQVLTLGILLPVVALSQGDISLEQKRFESKKREALAEIEKEHFLELIKLSKKYRDSKNPYLEGVAFKAAQDFASGKIVSEIGGTIWYNPGNTSSIVEFTKSAEIKNFQPNSWYSGPCEILALDSIQFNANGKAWTFKFDFVKRTAKLEKKIPGRAPETYTFVQRQ